MIKSVREVAKRPNNIYLKGSNKDVTQSKRCPKLLYRYNKKRACFEVVQNTLFLQLNHLSNKFVHFQPMLFNNRARFLNKDKTDYKINYSCLKVI